uniref:Uncharacterized protein n=1 Tax=Sphaerodactylus townsendi TaxID=933632 RepID=A0ACB8F2S8_9SAUR
MVFNTGGHCTSCYTACLLTCLMIEPGSPAHRCASCFAHTQAFGEDIAENIKQTGSVRAALLKNFLNCQKNPPISYLPTSFPQVLYVIYTEFNLVNLLFNQKCYQLESLSCFPFWENGRIKRCGWILGEQA